MLEVNHDVQSSASSTENGKAATELDIRVVLQLKCLEQFPSCHVAIANYDVAKDVALRDMHAMNMLDRQ